VGEVYLYPFSSHQSDMESLYSDILVVFVILRHCYDVGGGACHLMGA